MDRRQAGNCLTLADLLNNEMKDTYWDFSQTCSCAIGYARANIGLFQSDLKGAFWLDDFFGEKLTSILLGPDNASDTVLKKITKAQIRQKILRAVSTAGWEEA